MSTLLRGETSFRPFLTLLAVEGSTLVVINGGLPEAVASAAGAHTRLACPATRNSEQTRARCPASERSTAPVRRGRGHPGVRLEGAGVEFAAGEPTLCPSDDVQDVVRHVGLAPRAEALGVQDPSRTEFLQSTASGDVRTSWIRRAVCTVSTGVLGRSPRIAAVAESLRSALVVPLVTRCVAIRSSQS